MHSAMVELVTATTHDGLRLDGVLEPATAPGAFTVDAAILVHGTGSNFYGSGVLAAVASDLAACGVVALRINTRGHDSVSHAAREGGSLRQGAAFEIVDACRADIAAWLAFLVQRGHSRIALIGHSMGAVKLLYTLSQDIHPSVSAAVAISPPRLSHGLFRSSAHAAEFQRAYDSAVQSVEQGRPDTLLDVKFPIPYLVSAAGFIDKYGPADRYDFVPMLRRIECPLLVLLGTNELNHVAFGGLPAVLPPLLERREKNRLEIIAGADHFYIARRNEVTAAIRNWLGQ